MADEQGSSLLSQLPACRFLNGVVLLSDDGDFTNRSFASIALGGFYHVDAAGYFSAFEVASIPGVCSSIALSLMNERTIGGYDF